MEETIAWVLVIIAIVVALPFVLRYVLIGLYWFFAAAAHLYFSTLDTLTGASLIPAAPWVMWLFWGAVIGAALAAWTLAPVYGLRQYRVWIALAPFLLMLVTAALRAVIFSP